MSTSRTREKADGELFKSTGIDDNATSTKVTVSNTGIDVTGRATTDGITSSGTIIFDNGNSSVGIHSDSSDGSYIAYGANEYLRFLYDAGGGETMRMHDSGYVTMPQGVTLGNGNTYAAANTLDDYEEGAWTPIIRGNAPAPSGQSYAIQNGRYTKVGRLVTLEFDVELSAKGTVGGTYLIISGVPFSADQVHASGVAGVFFANMGISCTSVVATVQRNDQIFLWVTTAAQTTVTRTNPATSYLTDTTRFAGSVTFSTS
jgi:hypothetical protein